MFKPHRLSPWIGKSESSKFLLKSNDSNQFGTYSSRNISELKSILQIIGKKGNDKRPSNIFGPTSYYY